jgi:hypothetical protein
MYHVSRHNPITGTEETVAGNIGDFWDACDKATYMGRWATDWYVVRKAATGEAVAAYERGVWCLEKIPKEGARETE